MDNLDNVVDGGFSKVAGGFAEGWREQGPEICLQQGWAMRAMAGCWQRRGSGRKGTKVVDGVVLVIQGGSVLVLQSEKF